MNPARLALRQAGVAAGGSGIPAGRCRPAGPVRTAYRPSPWTDGPRRSGDAPGPAEPARPVDPIGELAAAAGYDDPERWWEDVVEHRGMPAFEAIAEAMAAIREASPEDPEDLVREAYMRTVLREVRRTHDEHRRRLRRLARARADPQGRRQGRRRAAQGAARRPRSRSPGCRGPTGGWRPGPATARGCGRRAGTTTCSPPPTRWCRAGWSTPPGCCGPRACPPRRRTSSRRPGWPRRWPRCAGGRWPGWPR